MNSKPADHWQETEVDMLRGDLDEAEARQYEAEGTAEKAVNDMHHWKAKYKNIKDDIDDRVQKMNGELRSKACIYLDIITEYDLLMEDISKRIGKMPTSTKMNDLRKRGGLDV